MDTEPSPAPRQPTAFETSGRTPELRLRLPSADFPRPYPLIVALHSLYHTGADAEAEWGLDDVALRSGFAVVYPDGLNGSWDAGSCCGTAASQKNDDVEWLRAMISHLTQTYPVDRRRVIIVGLSNGGMLAYRYACAHADEIAGIAVVAGSLQVSECRPEVPLPVLAIHGLADEHVPYIGTTWSRELSTPITSVENSLRPFRAAALCETPSRFEHVALSGRNGMPIDSSRGAEPDPDPDSRSVTRQASTGSGASPGQPSVAVRRQAPCLSGTDVLEYMLPRGGHGWPPLLGPDTFDTAEIIWRFLGQGRSRRPVPVF